MAKSRKLSAVLTGIALSFILFAQAGMTVWAGSPDRLNNMRGGVASILNPGSTSSADIVSATARELNLDLTTQEEEEEIGTLVMANVQNALNVRSDASEEASKVGKLYKDCGGIILERRDGWTKLQSGNIVGWASDEYLLFGEEARALANDVGRMTATVNTETLRVRMEPGTDAGVLGLLPKGEIVEVLNKDNEGWVCVDYEGADGYVSTDYVVLDFQIDAGETLEEIRLREEAEREAKRHVNYGAYTTDADTTLLLAALIQCEAGGEPYEGQVAVGAVVMNRVRSGAYPNSIHGVIYASGQFTPAQSGRVNAVYESGNIKASCIQAAEEAISGVSNVGDLTHFRRNNGRDGLVIGNHVFY
ncbi:MAG: cell wall hydrolase [Eubacterium sp.]|nr:cell wall hydrolase [Eubacterium sp.]MCM1213617.1 cell wall hydrolase [Lachnospiraceae bacterium]MCM1302751.1 cell wall hydrolase [Butyrivibrio sp.]MCM1342473.1 cell wall hydrolase [Muribaculaceae bacterium]MCM1239598.1 cell wall hydrolase [Lachnospiraceae bacterium]